MSTIKYISKFKGYLIAGSLVVVMSFSYTFMISVLFAQDYNSIVYYVDGGVSASAMGCLILFVIYKVDKVINRSVTNFSRSILAINILISLFIGIFLFSSTGWLLNGFLREQWTLDFTFLKQQILFINFILLLIFSYHTIAYFIRSTSFKNEKLKTENLEMRLALNRYLSRIPALSKKKTIILPVAKVLFFKIEDGIIFAYSSSTNKYALTLTTLNELEEKLNPSQFFRINRSVIVNIDTIDSYEPYFKDRLAIQLANFSTALYTSNTRSASFRKWILGNDTLSPA